MVHWLERFAFFSRHNAIYRYFGWRFNDCLDSFFLKTSSILIITPNAMLQFVFSDDRLWPILLGRARFSTKLLSLVTLKVWLKGKEKTLSIQYHSFRSSTSSLSAIIAKLDEAHLIEHFLKTIIMQCELREWRAGKTERKQRNITTIRMEFFEKSFWLENNRYC